MQTALVTTKADPAGTMDGPAEQERAVPKLSLPVQDTQIAFPPQNPPLPGLNEAAHNTDTPLSPLQQLPAHNTGTPLSPLQQILPGGSVAPADPNVDFAEHFLGQQDTLQEQEYGASASGSLKSLWAFKDKYKNEDSMF